MGSPDESQDMVHPDWEQFVERSWCVVTENEDMRQKAGPGDGDQRVTLLVGSAD